MAIKRSALALVALAGVLCSAALTLPTPVTPETESLKPGECEEYCTRSYPKHTYSEPSGHAACARGCRLLQLEAYLVYPSQLSSTDTACNNTCAKAYTDSHNLYACQFGCKAPSVAAFQAQASPSEDVWILSSLYEMIFLQEALERLDWQAEELAAQSKEGLITQHIVVFMSTGKDGGFPDDLRKEANSSFSGNSYAIDVDSNSPPVSTWHVYLASLSTLWSSSSNLGKEGPTKEVEPEVVVDHSWGSHLCNAHWNTLLDVFTVFAVILLILGLIDLCSSRRPRNKRDVHVEVKSPLFPVFAESDDEKNTKKKPFYVQDSNRYSYVPKEDKCVEGTLTVIRS